MELGKRASSERWDREVPALRAVRLGFRVAPFELADAGGGDLSIPATLAQPKAPISAAADLRSTLSVSLWAT
ncbi:hypothetical protein MSC49_39720 (plasmid) [Methylosinus sp. C49]|nr:hypothetical protein MSC49_39720 [Methylosinus sp. C49]